MKWKFDKVNGILYKGKKKIRKKDLDSFAEYAIWVTEDGEDLSNIFREETEDLPRLAEIRYYLDKNFADAYAKAKMARLSILEEQLIGAARQYNNTGDVSDGKKAETLDKIFTSLDKKVDAAQPINFIFNQTMPDDFWDKTCPLQPENPRDLSE